VDWTEITALAAMQHGLVSRQQLLAMGMSRQQVQRRLDGGVWERVLPGVYGICGHPPSWRRRLWAAHLHAGETSVLSHESAGRLHGFDQVPPGRVVLIAPAPGVRSPRSVRWHRLVDLEPADVVRLDGLPPLTAPARTVVDLAATLHPARLRLVVEQGILERSFDVAALGALLDRVRRRGKPGVRRLADVLDELAPGRPIPRSVLERHLDAVIARAGLPEAVREFPLPTERGRTGFVDRCFPNLLWIIEADGRRWHDRRTQASTDASRDLEAQALGYETTRLRWEHLVHDADDTARLLRQVYERRAALLATADFVAPRPAFRC
jgi:hypothetical protein